MYNAGKTKGIEGIDGAILWYGTFDFQRNSGGGKQFGDNIFYSAYTNASNYGAGVYMNGAGFSLNGTLVMGRIAADLGSKNAGYPEQRQWQALGWEAAEAQRAQWDKGTK